jgi:hypothetical protein
MIDDDIIINHSLLIAKQYLLGIVPENERPECNRTNEQIDRTGRYEENSKDKARTRETER